MGFSLPFIERPPSLARYPQRGVFLGSKRNGTGMKGIKQKSLKRVRWSRLPIRTNALFLHEDGPSLRGRGRLVADRDLFYFRRRRTVTQFVTEEPPTLKVTPTEGVFLDIAAPMGSPVSCL